MSLCCTVVSFVPFDIYQEKPGLIPPSFTIKESDMKTPSLLKVITATHFVYLDESRGMLQVKDPPDIIAKALVEDYCNSQLGIDGESGPALFWIPDDITNVDSFLEENKVMITRIKLRQKRWFTNITKMADDDWRKYHLHTVISDFQRKLAELLGLNPEDHEWMAPLSLLEEKTKNCPFCYSNIHKEASVCAVCGRVVDESKEQLLLTKKG